MNKNRLVSKMAEISEDNGYDFTKKDIETFLSTMDSAVSSLLNEDGRVPLSNIGILSLSYREGKKLKNNKLDKEIQMDPYVAVTFRSKKYLKDAIKDNELVTKSHPKITKQDIQEWCA